MARISGTYEQIKDRIAELRRKQTAGGLTATEQGELADCEAELKTRDRELAEEERLRTERRQREQQQREREEQERKRGGGR